MTDVYVYVVNLPDHMHEMVTPSGDGYTVYLHAGDTAERQREAYVHAISHIMDLDFEKDNVEIIEHEAHKKGA